MLTRATCFTCVSLILAAAVANAAPMLITGTPADSLLSTPTQASPHFGSIYNFDSLTPNTTFDSNSYGPLLMISSPDGLLVEPFSSQTFPNELFDDSSDGSANITISTSIGMNEIGVGIADSDPVTIMLQPLGSGGTPIGSPFSVTVPENTVTAGNAYYVIADTTPDIFGLQILQTSGSADYSGLAIDDVQIAPEPGSLLLLMSGGAFLLWLRLRKFHRRVTAA